MEKQVLKIQYRFQMIIDLVKTKNFGYLFIKVRHSLFARIKRFSSSIVSITTPRLAKEIEFFFKNKNFTKVTELYEQNSVAKISPDILKMVAKSYKRLERFNKHTALLTLVLEQSAQLSVDEIVAISKRNLDNSNLIVSSFEIINSKGGEANLGIIYHRINDKIIYVTKIKDMKNSFVHVEKHFYIDLLKRHSLLDNHSPKFIDYLDVPNSNLSLLTMEFIDGNPASINDWDKIEEFQSNLSKINYENNSSKYLDRSILIRNSYSIKLEYIDAIERIERFLKERYPSDLIYDDIKYLKSVILDKQHIKALLNKNHFVLQHRDFNPTNVLINKMTGNPIAIDWSSVRFDLIGMDLVLISIFFGLSYNEVTNKVIQKLKIHIPNTYIEVGTYLTIYYIAHKTKVVNILPDIDLSFEEWDDAISFIRGLHESKEVNRILGS